MPTDTNVHNFACNSIQRAGKSTMSRKFIVALTLLSALGLSFAASAACVYRDGGSTRGSGSVVQGPFHYQFAPFTINIDPNVAIGAPLGPTQTIPLSYIYDNTGRMLSQGNIDCAPTNLMTVSYDVTSGPLSSIPNVFETAIPGVGLRIKFSHPSQSYPYWPYVDSIYGSLTFTYITTQAALVLEFVKTGEIRGGGVIDGKIGRWFSSGPGEEWAVIGPSSPIIVKPTVPTCSVSTPDVQVPLAAADVTEFPSVGATAKEKDFKVSLACSGGNAGSKTTVNMSLADQTTPGNASTTLSLTSASTARGLGVQIVRNGTAISLDPAVNKFKVQDVLPGNSTVDIPFKGRYVRTVDPLMPGTVEAIATFTMEYK